MITTAKPGSSRPWLTEAVILCREAGMGWRDIGMYLSCGQKTIERAVSEGQKAGRLTPRTPPSAESAATIWNRVGPQIEAMIDARKAAKEAKPARQWAAMPGKRHVPPGPTAWASQPRNLEAVGIMRRAGMSRTGISHYLEVSESVVRSALMAAEAAGVDCATPNSKGTGGGDGIDDDALWREVRADVYRALGKRDPDAPPPPPPPLCDVGRSMVARGLSETQAREAAMRYRVTAADRESAMRRRARAGVVWP
jgi:hypothetical protein